MSVNLNLSQVTSNQDQKEVTINDATGGLDAAVTETLDNDYTSGNVTLTSAEFRQNFQFNATNLSTARTLTCPAIKRFFFVNNAAGTGTLSVIVGSTTIVIAIAGNGLFYADGTTNGLVQAAGGAGGAAGGDPIVGSFFPTAPGNSELMLRYVFAEAVDFVTSLTGSQAYCGTTATAQTDCDIQKNGVSVGTMRFAIATNAGTFIAASPTSFAIGDRLEIVGQATADTTLADISYSLLGTRP